VNIPFYFYSSVFLYVISVILYKKKSSFLSNGFFYILLLICFILYLFYGVANYFTGRGIDDSVIFHLKYGLQGAGFSAYTTLIIKVIIIIILTSILLAVVLGQKKHAISRLIPSNRLPFIFIITALVLNPATINMFDLTVNEAKANRIIRHSTLFGEDSINKSEFAKYYRKPYLKKVSKKNKNLVLIYGEGLERTYFDETVFPELIQGLRQLEAKSTYFTNIKEVAGTGWTIGGMVASQCGLPLFTPSHGNSMSGMDSFLASAVCLGDLLHEEGYELVYYGGADLAFAGKGLFYGTHKFDEICGRQELLPRIADQSYRSGWGLYDDSLLDLAFKRFMELSAVKKKFGLFLLTLDTHHPEGDPSQSCKRRIYRDGSNPILNAVSCSDYLLTKFVSKIMESPYADNTVVVIVSDHLSLRNTASDLLNRMARRNLFMILESGTNEARKIEKLGSTLDIGTTILPFIGYEGTIGLGRNLLGLDETMADIKYIQDHLTSWKTYISEFWNFPKIHDFIAIDIDQKKLTIDDRVFKIPILVEFDADLQTNMKFEFDITKKDRKLINYVRDVTDDKGFIFVDYCDYAALLDKNVGHNGYCMVIGRGQNYTKALELYGKLKITAEDIRKLAAF